MASPSVSISSSFPKGLRVLLVDQQPSRSYVEAQLLQPDLNYTVTACGSASEALSYCRSGVSSFDVVLAEAKLVAVDEVSGRAFIDSFEETPVVLMSEGSTTGDVLKAVKLGAVDWLDKPLSVLKLKNIWQHSVRKMMQRTTFYEASDQPPQPARSKLSSGIESPSTPTLGDSVDLDAISAASFGSIKDLTDFSFGGGAEVLRASFDSCDGTEVNFGSLGQPRPPMAVKPSSFGPLVPVPPTSQWPQLQPGCVWGTPVGTPLVPPTLPTPQQQSASLLGRGAGNDSHMSLSSLMEEDTPVSVPFATVEDGMAVPLDFLSKEDASGGCGPIGLKLKKSNSLLNLINAALMSGGQ